MAYDRTLVKIRERPFLDLLDLTLIVVRRRPHAVVSSAVVGIAPFAALNAWLLVNPDFPRLLWIPLLILEAPWATAPLTLVLGGLMFGKPPGWAQMLKRLLVGLPALVVTQLLLRGLLVTLFPLYPAVIPGRFGFLNEVILLERSRGVQAMRRCARLCRGREGDLLMYWLGQLFFGTVFALCFRGGTQALISALIGSELTWDTPGWKDLGTLQFHLAVWIAIAFFGVFRFLLYIDQRIRQEGWEVELRLWIVGRALEEGRR